jgi:endonuclease YncB( thermonuclease family)
MEVGGMVRLRRAAIRIGAVGAMAVVSITTFVSPPTVAADPVATTAEVLRVVDGDTIDIRDDTRGRLRVRVLGIDTPETKKPGFTVGCWGPEATEFATSTMLGQRVALVTDPTQDRTDRYGRTLAYLVRADGWDYSVEAARAGAAHSYVYGGVPVSHYAAIEAAEKEAQDALRGLWGPPCNGDTASIATTATAPQAADPPPPASAPAPFVAPPPPAAMPAAPPPASAYYGNCDAARAAGAAPIRVGQPGYRKGLDRDGDGTACDN